MTDVDFNMMPVDKMRGRASRAARAAASEAAATNSLKLSVHVNLEALEEDWRRLEASDSVSLHQGFDWCKAWAKSHGNSLLLVRGNLGQKTIFILPLELVRGRLFRTARFIGSPHSNINTGLFSGDLGDLAPQDFATSVIEQLGEKLSRVADIVTLEKMPFHWRGTCHPLASLPAVRNQNASYQLPLSANFEATLAQINAKRRRKKFRLSEKRLEALGGYDHVVAKTSEERRAFLDLFFAQKAERFKILGLPNVFQDAETQAFLHRLAALGETPDGHPLELNAIRLRGENDGKIIAIAGVSRKGDHVICQFGSIDETIAADSSPGELLFYLMIRRYCAEGAALFDFGIGDQPYKRSWCTVETIQRDIVLPLTLRGRIAAWSHRAIVSMKSTIKKNRHVYAFIQRLRQRRQGTSGAISAETDSD
jgi:CelD/BcsL family acetyltransferase involved in cellulose biosynthesis